MLVEATDDHFAALIAGAAPLGLQVPDGGVEAVEVLQMLQGLAQSVRQEISPASWLIVADGEIVGLCSITKAFPTPGTVEIGYGLAQTRRGRGHAAAAVAELLDWARSEKRVAAVVADTAVDNLPSQRVLERNGFIRVGGRIDAEDGPLICWRREVA
ncbi:MAG: GCN5-related N-acetyltransferase [Devosia sp.]|uniref:GNAT family N-acetyltransferase n=1 Tax=Devosia sp. TaxID=1871048 RepID=UPI0026278F60|nr:GNAT family N-acetyltransferase [Devosia sp.]MDB5586907.1 GCN5-related N-acetyltransferase [Devosia sp.]